jgi:hypothetical protein
MLPSAPHVEGLLYVMGRETGGRIPKAALGWFAGTENPGKAVAELLDCGIWKDHGEAPPFPLSRRHTPAFMSPPSGPGGHFGDPEPESAVQTAQ